MIKQILINEPLNAKRTQRMRVLGGENYQMGLLLPLRMDTVEKKVLPPDKEGKKHNP